MGEQLRLFSEPRVGYISALSDHDFHWGGLLVIDRDGDPVEFVYTEPVELTGVMKTLLGSRARGFVVARLLAGPLLASCKVPPDIICFDEAGVLQRRVDINIPAAVFASNDCEVAESLWQRLDPLIDNNDGAGEWWGQISSLPEVQSILKTAVRCLLPGCLSDPFKCLGEALRQFQPQGRY